MTEAAKFASQTEDFGHLQDSDLPAAAIEVAATQNIVAPADQPKWYRWRKDGKALALYLLDSEVHTFAFSVAANAILSFVPFIVLLYTLAERVFHSPALVKAVNQMVVYFMPSNQDFVTKNLDYVALQSSKHGIQFFSLVMILVACTGIFLPLEVALNQAWGVTKSRNYLLNQLVSLGLALLMLALGLASVALNAGANTVLDVISFHHTDNFIVHGISWMILAASTGVASILFFFAIYWVLPNRKVPVRPVFHTAVITGVIWLVAKFIFVLLLPRMDLPGLYGAFHVSVGLLFWAYISGLILFAGAQFSVARLGGKEN